MIPGILIIKAETLRSETRKPNSDTLFIIGKSRLNHFCAHGTVVFFR